MTLPPLHTLREAQKLTRIGIGTLRTAIERGQLSCRRIGGRVFVTDSDLQEMIDRCRHEARDQGFTSDDAKDANQSGSSETEPQRKAQVAALATIKQLRKRSPTTSRENTSQSSEKASSPESRLQT